MCVEYEADINIYWETLLVEETLAREILLVAYFDLGSAISLTQRFRIS